MLHVSCYLSDCGAHVNTALSLFTFALVLNPTSVSLSYPNFWFIFLSYSVSAQWLVISDATIVLHLHLRLFGSWYHGNISRDDVEKLMNPPEDGLFLVRESANYPGDYTLCVAFGGKVEHYHISIKDNRLTVDDETFFDNMVKLVEVRSSSFKWETLMLWCNRKVIQPP